MNILLIRPKPHRESIGLQSFMICEPLELEYLSSFLEQDGHKVKIVDMILETKKIGYFIKNCKPNIVAFTAYIIHVGIVKKYARASPYIGVPGFMGLEISIITILSSKAVK